MHLQVREIISLTEHEAVVLKTQTGSYDIRFGDPAKGTERAFFLPPHWEVVTLMWSRGRRREKRDLAIQVHHSSLIPPAFSRGLHAFVHARQPLAIDKYSAFNCAPPPTT